MFKSDYIKALDDYRIARRRAAVQELLSRLFGDAKDLELLSYDDVRKQLQAVEKSTERLEEIPLDSIVGSVGRYHDFTRKYLPKASIDRGRWARVMASFQGMKGLPPIDVYRLGSVYFVRDGNHRVSVARQMGSDLIQAYVTDVESKVELTADVKPDDLIIKTELVKFLEVTRLDQSQPDLDLDATKAGAYPTLLEHIAVHRYYLGMEQNREVSIVESAQSWYRNVYLPIVNIIRSRNLLAGFPDRTETDLYLWAADHRAMLKAEVGWDIGAEAAISDLSEQHSRERKPLKESFRKFIQAILPDSLESGPPIGSWRERLFRKSVLEHLFNDLTVAVDDSQTAWHALDLAIVLSKMENSRVHGIHIHPELAEESAGEHLPLKDQFSNRLEQAAVSDYDFKVFEGDPDRILCDQARFVDLILIPLNHPPDNSPISRLGSGIVSLIRNCSVPILTVPTPPTLLKTLLVAYDGSQKAKEALFIAAYFGTQHSAELIVLTSHTGVQDPENILDDAREYLAGFPLQAKFLLREGPLAEEIAMIWESNPVDLVVIGGYGGSGLRGVMLGSAVDQVLREIPLPVLICR